MVDENVTCGGLVVRVVMAMYDGPETSVRVNGVQSEDFKVKVCSSGGQS